MKQLNQIYINGEFVTPHGTRTLDLLSPVTNEKVAQVTLGDEVDTQNAIVAAKKAFKTFSQTSKEERIGYLEKMHEILKRRRQKLIDVMIDEYGCPLYFTTSLIDLAVDDFKIMAQLLKDFDLEPKVGHSRVTPPGLVAAVRIAARLLGTRDFPVWRPARTDHHPLMYFRFGRPAAPSCHTG